MMILPVVVNLIANPLQVDCPRNDDIILNAHIFFIDVCKLTALSILKFV